MASEQELEAALAALAAQLEQAKQETDPERRQRLLDALAPRLLPDPIGMRRNDLLGKIAEKLDRLVTLEIATVVGRPVPNEHGDGYRPPIEADADAMLTRIDLVQGDVTTVIPAEFLADNRKELRDFHAEREQRGHAIIQNNLDALARLLELGRSGTPGSAPAGGGGEPQ